MGLPLYHNSQITEGGDILGKFCYRSPYLPLSLGTSVVVVGVVVVVVVVGDAGVPVIYFMYQ